jgi:hypothetical protein
VAAGLWKRLLKRSRERAAERERELLQMSEKERRDATESIEERAGELESEAHLGGEDPERLLDGGR